MISQLASNCWLDFFFNLYLFLLLFFLFSVSNLLRMKEEEVKAIFSLATLSAELVCNCLWILQPSQSYPQGQPTPLIPKHIFNVQETLRNLYFQNSIWWETPCQECLWVIFQNLLLRNELATIFNPRNSPKIFSLYISENHR